MSNYPTAIHQMLPCFAQKDAIGIHTLALQKQLQKRGFHSEIYYEIKMDETASFSKPLDTYVSGQSPAMVIYHHSTSSQIPLKFLNSSDYFVQLYHNVTPDIYFTQARDQTAVENCKDGLRLLYALKLLCKDHWSASHYNAKELEEHGIPDAKILPLLRDYGRLTQHTPLNHLTTALKDGRPNILFTGRIVPSKCQKQLVMVSLALQKLYGLKPRLLLVGAGAPVYMQEIKKYCQQQGLKLSQGLTNTSALAADVVFCGHISDRELTSIYRCADLFLCLSEHEGFCVPLVEAMAFGIPIIAHDATAVPETLGSGGLLVQKHDFANLINTCHKALTDQELAQELKKRAQQRYQDFEQDKQFEKLDQVLSTTLENYAHFYHQARLH